jgi:hypothetical protein
MRLIALLGLLVSPTALIAEVCDIERPHWNGSPVTVVQEAAILFTQPTQIILLAATLFLIYRKARIGCGLLALVWAAFIPSLLTRDLDDATWEAFQEGCIGGTDLSIGLSAAICILTLYAALRPRRNPKQGDI